MQINSVCIVGGGSAGWMTAAAFSKLLPNMKITLVESPEISKVGIGESTIAEIHEFLNAIGVQDKDWMRECDATFKLGINFVDFKDNGKNFLYPFVNHKTLRDPTDWFQFKLANKNFEYSYTDYVQPEIALMSKKNRLTNDISLPSLCVNRKHGFMSHAHQVDAIMYAEFLKNKIAVPNGVRHILDHVVDYNVFEEKLVSIKTKEGLTVEADLFIDCTGFRSSILEGVFKVKHTPFKHLLNDSALFAQVKYTEESKEKELEVVTDCTATGNGWIWNIPLWSRVGTGYVFSSKHADKQVAEQQYRDYLSKRFGHERVKDLSFKSLNIRNGRHEKCWVSNVVAIGLSYGFIEPLESTGLYFVHEGILRVADFLKQRDGFVGKADVDVFNKNWDKTVVDLLWFVSMHFFLSKRQDTQYWKDCVKNVDLLEDSANPLLDYLTNTKKSNYQRYLHGYNFICLNMDILPVSYVRQKLFYDNDVLNAKKNQFIKAYHEIEKIVDSLPTHYELLRDTIYK
jgi:tryptophan halogenase